MRDLAADGNGGASCGRNFSEAAKLRQQPARPPPWPTSTEANFRVALPRLNIKMVIT